MPRKKQDRPKHVTKCKSTFIVKHLFFALSVGIWFQKSFTKIFINWLAILCTELFRIYELELCVSYGSIVSLSLFWCALRAHKNRAQNRIERNREKWALIDVQVSDVCTWQPKDEKRIALRTAFPLLMPMQSKQISQAYTPAQTVNLFDIKIYSSLIFFISSFI